MPLRLQNRKQVLKRTQGLTNVVKALDDFVQACNLQDLVQPGGGVKQLQFSTSFF
jgi:hypothetical protein